MPECPYPETVTVEVSCRKESNSLYGAWREGFEAHKFEMVNQLRKLAILALMLDSQIVKVNELQRELGKQKAKLQKTN